MVAPDAADHGLRDRPARNTATSSTATPPSRPRSRPKAGARAELARIDEMGGAVAAIDDESEPFGARWPLRPDRGRRYWCRRQPLHRSRALAAMPATTASCSSSPRSRPGVVARLAACGDARDASAVAAASLTCAPSRSPAATSTPASVATAKAGATTGEAGAPGHARPSASSAAPTGVAKAATTPLQPRRGPRRRRGRQRPPRPPDQVPGRQARPRRPLGAEQIAVRARDSGDGVVYEGIRLTATSSTPRSRSRVRAPSSASPSAAPAAVHRGHGQPAPGAAGLDDIRVVVGGIIPDADATALLAAGVARVYTPKDFELNRIMLYIVALRYATAREVA